MKKSSHSSFGFTLIELLTVTSIVSILAVVTLPALSSISGANGTTRAALEISNAMEHARQSAMQTGTWVWVGMADVTEYNNQEATIALIELASRDGSTSTANSNLMPLTRPRTVQRAQMSSEQNQETPVLGGASPGFSLTWEMPTASGKKAINFSKYVVGFSPRGEAVLSTTSVPEWIRVVVTSPKRTTDAISILISGPSGNVVASR